MRSQEDDCKYL